MFGQEGVISSVVAIAESCPVLTVRGTAFFGLGLVATTRAGIIEGAQRPIYI